MRNTAGGTLAATNVTKSFGADVVLDGVSVVVPPRARIGVIGPNGSGKTTLLRMLVGLEVPDVGRVERRPASLTVGYLPQEGPVQSVDAPEWKLRRAAARIGLDVDPRVGTELSGGQLPRAKLAALLAADHDVLLLDEPTNDLDFAGLARLERFVEETPSALVIVSHDRAFLEHAVESIFEFEAETRKVREFRGSWGEYERLRELGRRREEEAYARYAGDRDRFTAPATAADRRVPPGRWRTGAAPTRSCPRSARRSGVSSAWHGSTSRGNRGVSSSTSTRAAARETWSRGSTALSLTAAGSNLGRSTSSFGTAIA